MTPRPDDDQHRVAAAAPDLLEALRLHVDYQAIARDRNGDETKALAFGRFLEARDAAIAKAEGRP